jgi:hypothetical protein
MQENNSEKTFIIILLCAILAFAAPTVAAQEKAEWDEFPYALGAGLEMNMNTKEGWAQGYTAGLDRHLGKHLLVGLRGGMNDNLEGITGSEANLFLRLYLYKLGLGGAFTQIGYGISSFQEDELRKKSFLMEYTAGFRFFFFGGFYAEAYARSGYPFKWGLGLMAGHRFNF